MKPFTVLCLLFFTSPCIADTVSIDLEKQEISDPTKLDSGVLRIQSTGSNNQPFALFSIEKPAIEGESFFIKGEVRYEGVEGDGFLEMWTNLPAAKGRPAGRFFSRTLGMTGPMQKLNGSQEWREFQLPAMINDGSKRIPTKLELNVFLPGKGLVEIRNLELTAPIPGATESPMKKSWNNAIMVGLGVTLGFALFFVIFALRNNRSRREIEKMSAVDSVD